MSPAEGASAPPNCLILGLGNRFLRDGGIGVHAARALSANPPPGAKVVEVGTNLFGSVSCLDEVPWMLAIDAMDAGEPPGSIYRCDVSVAGANLPLSLHEMSVEAVIGCIPEARRPAITILGVQPAVVRYGVKLSPELKAALPRVVCAARLIVAEWQLSTGFLPGTRMPGLDRPLPPI